MSNENVVGIGCKITPEQSERIKHGHRSQGHGAKTAILLYPALRELAVKQFKKFFTEAQLIELNNLPIMSGSRKRLISAAAEEVSEELAKRIELLHDMEVLILSDMIAQQMLEDLIEREELDPNDPELAI